MARKKRKKQMYRFVVDVDYDVNSKHYEAGQEDDLRDWRKQHVGSAIASGLIIEVATGGDDGRSNDG